jgi:hypothetical protein
MSVVISFPFLAFPNRCAITTVAGMTMQEFQNFDKIFFLSLDKVTPYTPYKHSLGIRFQFLLETIVFHLDQQNENNKEHRIRNKPHSIPLEALRVWAPTFSFPCCSHSCRY